MIRAENYSFSVCFGLLWEIGEAQICCVRIYFLKVRIRILATTEKDTGSSE